ncbi:RNA-directed DNA polymerase, eukaryota [Tanacetum coccineum]
MIRKYLMLSSCKTSKIYNKGYAESFGLYLATSTAITSVKDWTKKLETKFRKKIEILLEVNHENFVNLIGYCEEQNPFTRMMVFEYAPNGTLFEHLHRRLLGPSLQHKHIFDPLWNLLTSLSGVQRQVASLVLISWFKEMKCRGFPMRIAMNYETHKSKLELLPCTDPSFSTKARDLWNVCLAYGTVVDVYIPFKKSKAGKKFAFVRFIKVDNLDRLIRNLCTIWIGRFRLHANSVRFQREPKTNVPSSQPTNSSLPGNNGSVGAAHKSFATVLSNGIVNPNSANATPALVLDDSCILERDFSCSLMGKIKDINALSNLYVILVNEGFEKVSLSYLGGHWVLLEMDSKTSKDKVLSHIGVGSWFMELKQATNSFVCDERLVWVTIEGLPVKAITRNTFIKIISSWGELVDIDDSERCPLSCIRVCVKTKPHVLINDRIKIIIKGQIHWIRVKELEAWMPDFTTDKEDDISSNEESEGDNANGVRTDKEEEYDHVSETNFTQEQEAAHFSNSNGFTPVGEDSAGSQHASGNVDKSQNPPQHDSAGSQGDGTNSAHTSGNKVKSPSVNGKHSSGAKFQASGSILEVMDELIKVGQTMGYNMDGCMKNIEAIIETKMDKMDLFSIKALWGNLSFDYAFCPSIGFSGGILCVWDPSLFVKENVTVSESFLAITGTWIPSTTKLLIISIYAPQDLNERRLLWDFLHHLIESWDGEYMLMGDFNEVRFDYERFGSLFNSLGAIAFNNFITMAGLIDLPLEGYSFTWSHKTASKMSKLDRFLISEGLLSLFPSISALCLDKYLSDHRPILLRELAVDYGPTPFRFFHSWFSKKGFDKMVEETWKNTDFMEENSIIKLKKKLQALKSSIKQWLSEEKQLSGAAIRSIQERLTVLDKSIDQHKCNEEMVNERTNLLKKLQDLKANISIDMAQKAKIRWAIEGDENSKFFHGIINKKRSQLAIRGVLVDGDWISEPVKVKSEFHNHFSNRFAEPTTQGITFDTPFPNRLSPDQIKDLERLVSYDEIKCAVWDCGTNKSPGPDGFTFEFYRRYWNIIDHDVVAAVKLFFELGYFPPGCNSSFIALIPKNQEAKMVKDFRPISLIGSVYKIITKVLANRLCLVISDLSDPPRGRFIMAHFILPAFFMPYLFCSTADDVALFIRVSHGSLSPPYLSIIVNVLKWFYLASGLKINLHKSKLMGIGISHDAVVSAARSIGCTTFQAPFNYLGVKVGLPVPKGVLYKLESIRKIFFNGVENSEKKVSLICWKKVLASKLNGGLGVSSFFATNRALLFKWIWRFFSDGTSLWSRFIIAIHGVRGTLDTSIIVSKRSPWLDIVREFKDLSNNGIDLLSLIKKKVGNGVSTSFWEDVWLADSPLKNMYPRLYLLEADKHSSVASKLLDSFLIASFRRHPRGDVEEEQLQRLIETWNFIDDSFLLNMETPTRWVKTIPIKINIFAWKVFLDKLPTRLNLSLRGIDIPSIICPLCSITVESTSHLFFSCHLARQLLIKVARWWELEIHDFTTYDEWLFWLTNLRVSKGFKNVFEGVCYTTWWVIWKFRNQVLFGNNFPRLDLLFDEIVRLSFNWVSSRCKPSLDWNSWMKNPSSISL